MEVLSGYTTSVKFPVPSGVSTATFTIIKNDVALGSTLNATISDGVATCVLPYSAVSEDATLKVTLRFSLQSVVYEPYKIVTVVTPILELFEIQEIHPNATTQELINVERAVRTIIQSHTGQRFAKSTETKDIRGNDTRLLELPERLIELTSVNDVTNVDPYFSIEAEGFYLTHYPWGVPPVKADYYGLHEKNGVITNPNNVNLGVFFKLKTYKINGVWGWLETPEAVKEAARLLVNDYACQDSSYRDRYLTSMTAADWRIQFHSGAFLKTGNVRADQLLNDYVLKRGWAVI